MAKKFTSASAAKAIRLLEDEKTHLLAQERERSTYTAQVGENPDIPAYDFDETSSRVRAIDDAIRKIRCGIHRFNMETTLETSKITIDEALVFLAQLSQEKSRLANLRGREQKKRVSNRFLTDGAIEYEYANYDVDAADRAYTDVLTRISSLQLELDCANQIICFEVDVEDPLLG